MIGIVVILLGLAAAGVLADAAVGGVILGALAVTLVGAGVALLRARRRRHHAPALDQRELERRVEQLAARSRLLESQNASLNQENAALRQWAEELEGGPPPHHAEEFAPPARQVSKTALILVPPPPASPDEEAPHQRATGEMSS